MSQPECIDEVVAKLAEHSEFARKWEILRGLYPVVFLAFLKGCGMTKYAESMFRHNIDPDHMGWYINDYLLPMLTKMREEGKL